MSKVDTTIRGKITQVLGPVVDVEFPENQLPPILTALQVTNPFINDQPWNLTLEVSQHLGNNLTRAIAMDSTDGLVRGTEVRNSGEGITVPVGPATLGRVMNLLGEPIDNAGPIVSDKRLPIHRSAPRFQDQDTRDTVLVTGIKVIDLLAPIRRAERSACSAAPEWARPC